MYYDCRYLSACEATWRILSFERLPLHLPNEQGVIFDESESLDNVLNNPCIHQTKFNFGLDGC